MTRHIVIVLLALAVLLVAAATGGFSATEADRGVQITVADSDRAYLGIESLDPSITGEDRASDAGESVVLFELTNNLHDGIEIDAEVEERTAGSSVGLHDDLRTPNGLEPGASGTIDATVDCPGGVTSETVDVGITVETDDGTVFVQTTQSVTISCDTTPESPGGGLEPPHDDSGSPDDVPGTERAQAGR